MNKTEAFLNIRKRIDYGEFSAVSQFPEELLNQCGEAERIECVGDLYFRLRDFKKAISFYESMIAEFPTTNSARYQYLVGLGAESKGDFEGAFLRYQGAIELEPEFVDPYNELGAMLIKVEDFEGALQCFQDAIKLAPDDIVIIHNLLELLYQLAERNPIEYQEMYLDFSQKYKDFSTPRRDDNTW